MENVGIWFGRLLDGAEGAGGEGEEGGDELEYAADYDTDEAEGEKEQPDDGVENQREQSDGPAEDQEDEEEEKLHRDVLSVEVRGRGEVCSRGGCFCSGVRIIAP